MMTAPKAFLPLTGSISFWKWAIQYNAVQLPLNFKISKKSYANRLYIAYSGGVQLLSIPIDGGRGVQSNYLDLKISNSNVWQSKLWLALQSAYGKSPFFDYYKEDMKELVFNSENKLYLYNLSWINWINKCLKTKIQFECSLSGGYDEKMYNEIPEQEIQLPIYPQVFRNQHSFFSNLSIIDLIMNIGQQSNYYISSKN